MSVIEIVGSFHINSREVEHHLERSPFRYPRNSEVDDLRGFGRVAVIPTLFAECARLRRFVRPDEGVRLLMDACDPACADDPRVQRRADKLYLDFARDMHTLGLLQRCDVFGVVDYQKALDLAFNVDFVASLGSWVTESTSVGVQAAMRAYWGDGDPFEARKATRRARRKDSEWEGRIYWLTNQRTQHAKSLAGTWLFGEQHVRELGEQIRSDQGASDIAIQQQMELF